MLCAVLGILLGYLILFCMNPGHATEGIIAILRNFFKFYAKPQQLMYYLGSTLVKAVPVILCSEAILFAYKAGLFNIGVAGQYTVGIIASLPHAFFARPAFTTLFQWNALRKCALIALNLLTRISGWTSIYRTIL